MRVKILRNWQLIRTLNENAEDAVEKILVRYQWKCVNIYQAHKNFGIYVVSQTEISRMLQHALMR